MTRQDPPVDVGSGEGVALLHGFLGCAEDMADLARTLGAGRRAVALDLPGHGPEPPPVAGRGNSFFAAVDDVTARLARHGLDHFDVVAYSMGGRLAFGMLVKYPERVRRAVIIGSSPGIEDARLRRARLEADRRLAERIEREPLDAFIDWWYGQRLFGALKEHVSYPELVARRRSGHATELARALLALSPGVQPSLWEDLARARTPMLVIAGERDLKYARLVREAATRFPAARAEILAGAGHAVHVERATEVAALADRFLNEDPPPGVGQE